jgi:hypothetical protein
VNEPDQYTVRLLAPGDADGVAALVRRVYGDRYSYHEEIYDPRQIRRMNETGQLVSVVALDAAGAVVGHSAIVRHELGLVAETGESMVLPEHRSHHLMQRMQELLHEQAPRLGLAGLYGGPVTSHVFSQKAYEALGLHPCGILLGMLPAAFQKLPQRMSDVPYFRFVRPPAPTVVHMPAQHRAIAERIYAQFAVPVEFRPGEPLAGEGRLVTTYRSVTQSGTITVQRSGANTPADIARGRRALLAMGAEVIYLDLPLAQAQTPELCRAVEREGFFFAVIAPLAAPDGDILRLQFLSGDLDPALVQLENPFARELLDFAMRERRRVGEKKD